jgi:hypothetical protein
MENKTRTELLKEYWEALPVGKENAVTYAALSARWDLNRREVRRLLHELSTYDNGDEFILIRSASGQGFYKTDDPETIATYKKELINKGLSTMAPIRKINRVTNDRNTLEMYGERLV